MKLNEIKINDTAIIKENNTSFNIKRRLLDLGLIPNTKIKCLFSSVFGNIRAYLIRNSLIAIRNNDASKIEVVVIDE